MKESISTYLKFGSLLESSGKIKKAKNVYEMVINKWPNEAFDEIDTVTVVGSLR